jgi:formylglycine-generating enzyme required for sulfatase activity
VPLDLAAYRKLGLRQRQAWARETAERLADVFEPAPWRPRDELFPSFVERRSGLAFTLVVGGEFDFGFSAAEERRARRLRDPPPLNLEEMRPVRRARVDSLLVARTPVTWATAAGVLGRDVPAARREFPAFLARAEAEQVVAALASRLPRETEWEYVCRAGTTSPFVFGDEPPSEAQLERWLGQDFSDLSRLQANPFGLYGMFTGEWCSDAFAWSHAPDAPVEPGSHVVRGGGSYFWPWQDDEWVWCLSAMRMPSKDLVDGTCGLRLVRDLPR